MGLFRVISGAVSAADGVDADQWQNFYTLPDHVSSTTALAAAVHRGTNFGRGENVVGSNDVITNGSKIVVPEGYGLVLMQDGAVTGFVSEAGAYEWNSDAQDSQSIFAGDGFFNSTVKTSWERFKFGGRPQGQQRAYFVALKELPGNRFGTASEIYWDDAYLNAQVGAVTRGTFTLRILDPILFIRNWLPASYLEPGVALDFTDFHNEASRQLFDEVVASLATALSIYTNDPSKGNRISRIQQDSIGFGAALAEAVDNNFGWKRDRGIEIVKTAIVAIEYDESSRELLRTVQRADALGGARGVSNLQASLASGVEASGVTGEGAAGILGLGLVANANNFGLLNPGQSETAASAPDDPVQKLRSYKEMLDAGLITAEEYDIAKAKVLGL